jgi:hypothetical protein
MKSRFFFTVCFSFILGLSRSQSTTGSNSDGQSNFPQYMPTIMPPSPDAYSFTKYGNLPIGISTGTAQFNFPIYSLSSGKLKHEISLNYSSNGVRVDEMATRVGINWNLRVGGQITRIIMDKPDDAAGVSRTFYHGYTGTDSTNHYFYNYVKQAAYSAPPDFQPDEYSFSVDGYSGKFLQREDGSYLQFGASKMKIEKNSNGFLLIGTEGNKYYFYLSEGARNYGYPEIASLEWIPTSQATAWYLTKIVSPSNDSIVFHYVIINATYINGISQDLSLPSNRNWYHDPITYEERELYKGGAPGETTIVQMTDNNPYYITSVDFPLGKAKFIYSSRDDVPDEKKLDSIKIIRATDSTVIKSYKLTYAYSNATEGSYDTYFGTVGNFTSDHEDLRKRLFLTEIQELSNDLATNHKQQFEYDDIDGLPPRLSFSQDRYGYFNGKVNAHFYPNDTWFEQYLNYRSGGGNRDYSFSKAKKGLLKKIVYPTGGYTEIEYEPNKTQNDYAYIKHVDSVYTLFDTSSWVGQTVYSDTFYHSGSSCQKTLILKGYCNWASTPVNTTYMGIDTALEGVYHITFSLIDISNNSCSTVCNMVVNPGESFDLSAFYCQTLPMGTYKIKAIANRPRLRAKIVAEQHWKEVDRSDSSGIAGVRVKTISDYAMNYMQTNKREYIYGYWGSSDSSSGWGLNINVNNGNEVSATRLIYDGYCTGYNTIHSNSIFTNYLTENNAVFYKNVIELNTSTDTAKKNGGTEYQFDYIQKQYPIPVRFNEATLVWQAWPVVPNNASYMNNDFKTGTLTNKKIFTYLQKHGWRNILQETFNHYSVDTLAIDTFTVCKEVLKRDYRGFNWPYFWDYDIYRYWRYFGFLKLDSTIATSYSGTHGLVDKTVYGYTNANYKVASQTHYTSDGGMQQIFYRYPGNIVSSETDYSDYHNMVNANIVDPPVNVSAVKNSSSKSQQTYYDYLTVGGNSFYQAVSVKSQVNSNTAETELMIEQYNSSGNIVQYKGRDGITNSIIWGYGGIYPIAKVQGASYNDCIAALNSSIINSPASDYALRAELNKLRTQLSGTVFVNTLTYSPLIGVTSETNINNRTVYYEYDNYNRLKLIRDQDSNIVKRICYNFKGEETECSETHSFPATPCGSYNCSGYDHMCISGTCVQSTTIVLISSEDMGNGTWKCTYAYSFAGGTITGQEWDEYQPALFGCLEPF